MAGSLAPIGSRWPGLFAIVCLAAASAPAADDAPAAADAETARRVIDRALNAAAAPPEADPAAAPLAPAAGPADSLTLARVSAEVAAKQLEAKRLAQRAPADALALLDATATGLDNRGLPPATRDQLLRRIERTRQDIEQISGRRRAELAL
jgi:hypothetical protein